MGDWNYHHYGGSPSAPANWRQYIRRQLKDCINTETALILITSCQTPPIKTALFSPRYYIFAHQQIAQSARKPSSTPREHSDHWLVTTDLFLQASPRNGPGSMATICFPSVLVPFGSGRMRRGVLALASAICVVPRDEAWQVAWIAPSSTPLSTQLRNGVLACKRSCIVFLPPTRTSIATRDDLCLCPSRGDQS